MAITPFKVIQGTDFGAILVIYTKVPPICTVSKLRLIIGQIFANDKESLHFNAPARGDSLRMSP